MKIKMKQNLTSDSKNKLRVKGKLKKNKPIKQLKTKWKMSEKHTSLVKKKQNVEGAHSIEDDANDEDDIDDGTESEEVELEENEDMDHKKALNKLKKTDPEFYKFLEQNDKALLEFDLDNDDDLSSGDEVGDEDRIHKPPKPGELEVNSDEDDFDDEKVVSQRSDKQVTLKMVKKWQNELITDNSAKTISVVIKAFHAALISVTGANQNEDGLTSEYKVEGSAVFNAVVQLCVLELQPALVRYLKLPTERAALIKSQPAKAKKWSKMKAILKTYFSDLLKLLGGVTSEHIQCVMLKHVHQMSMFITYFQRIVKLLLRRLVNLWSAANEETVRVLAFLCILRITTSQQKVWLEPALKMMYTSYISNSKFVSPSTLPGINFMRRSLTEILSIDANISYHHAFLYIRQLAIHLRNAITLHKKESIQAVYNWQYVCSLHLWSDLLAVSSDKPQLQMLIFPLVQVIIGCIKLIPTAQYYPLRFHCCQMLIDLSKETGTYIPVLPFIIEAITLTNFDKGHKILSMKPMDMTCLLRLSKSMLQENAFKDAVIEQIYRLLVNSLAAESHRLSFPDLTLLPLIQLKNFCKSCKINKYVQKVRGAINKIEESSKFIEAEKKKVSFILSDKKSIEAWERSIQARGTPLSKFCEQLKKIYEQQDAKRITQNDKLGEFKLPVLKKGEKRRNKEEPVIKFSSDGESSGDEDSLFKFAGENTSIVKKENNKPLKKKSNNEDDFSLNNVEKKKKIKSKKGKLHKNANNNESDVFDVNGNDSDSEMCVDKQDTVTDFKFSDSE